jgi:hypothetical protein
MANKHDWEKWRRLYVVGGDDVTLPTIAVIPGAPSLPSLKRVCAAELWADQRKRFRMERDTVTIRDDAAVSAVNQVERIIDAAEMLTRHAKASRLVGQKAIQAMQMVDPATLKPADALAWLKFAVEAERLTEGLATQRQEIDLSNMTDAELEKLANGGT